MPLTCSSERSVASYPVSQSDTGRLLFAAVPGSIGPPARPTGSLAALPAVSVLPLVPPLPEAVPLLSSGVDVDEAEHFRRLGRLSCRHEQQEGQEM